MRETDKLLARIKNLIGEDSTILKGFEDKIDKVSKDKVKWEETRKKIEKDITDIQSDIDSITKASELSDRFDNLDEYESGLKKLGGSLDYIKKIKEELDRIPVKIEELENKINDLNEKGTDAEKTIKEDEDELSKLDVDLSDAKRYQGNLVDLIDLACKGDINKTRDEVVETLKHVGFEEKDALATAKLILFPEDELIPYFNDSSKKDEVKEEVVEDTTNEEENDLFDNIEEETTLEDTNEDEIVLDNEEEEEEVVEDTEEVTEMPDVPFVDDIPYEDNSEVENTDTMDVISNTGLDVKKFSEEDINLLSTGDSSVITKNVDFLLDKNISKEFIYKYPSILLDNEIEDKYNFIINNLGKEEEDIKINPLILISYTLSDFEKLESIASRSGVNAKDIPLMVYIKGLQAFLQNYMLLKNNDIDLDDNELAKVAAVLTIDPDNFKESIEAVKKYDLSLRKSNGKYAVMCLARPTVDLVKDMDLIIETGEYDILKYYPEVLNEDALGLVNRLVFIKKTGIPYKATAHGDVIYQSYVLSQDKLNKIVEKKLELHEVADRVEANDLVRDVIKNSDVIDYLDNMNDLNNDSNDYEQVISSYKNIEENENTYVIGGIVFSKNKVRRNINNLKSNYPDLDNNIIILASLFYDSRRNRDELNKVISQLGIRLG